MAGLAVIYDAKVIERGGQKTSGHVAIAAVAVGGNVVIVFSGCHITIVTRRAVIQNTLMIKMSAGKRYDVVTHGAVLRRSDGNVIHRQAGRRSTIVARPAVVDDTHMIEYCCCKGARHVADAAIFICHNVVDSGVLADSVATVVAGITPVPDNFRASVVNKSAGKIHRVVAHRTIPGCILMHSRGRLSSGAKPNMVAIVAGRTVAREFHMIKVRRQERADRVAEVTILRRW